MLMEERPPLVEFEQKAVVDAEATRKAGHVVYKNVHYVKVTPFGTKDQFVNRADKWLEQQRKAVKDKRIPPQFFDYYQRTFDAYKAGNEEVINGTSIKLWPTITPAEVQMILQGGVKTVEDLAVAPELTLQAIGMGARGLQRKAKAWLESASGPGIAQSKIADLESRLEQALNSITERDSVIDELQREIRALSDQMENGDSNHGKVFDRQERQTNADEAQSQEEVKPRRGRPRKTMVA